MMSHMQNTHPLHGAFLMIGCGNMGRAMLNGWLQAGALKSFTSVTVCKPSLPSAKETLANVKYITSLAEFKEVPTVIVIATKPDKVQTVLAECKAAFKNHSILYLSIAAGKTIPFMQAIVGGGC